MKSMIIGGIVGLLFMSGGFYFGLRLKPLPVPKSNAAPAAVAKSDAVIPQPGSPITIDTLRKTSESMMSLNQALEAREQAVAEREKKVQEREDELSAERDALDRSHAKFKELYNEFQARLQLVEANQVDQLQKQADLYDAMGTTQSIELIRAMDDSSMIRLFSVMDTKPLAKLIAEWKTKYPEDVPRLLHELDGMAQVMPKEKIALSDTDSAPAPDSGSSGTPTSATPASPAPDSSTPDPSTPAPSDSTPPASAPAPAADPSAAPAPAPPSPADTTPASPLAPPPDSTPAPVSTAASN